MDENINKIANEFLDELVNNIKKESRLHYIALNKQMHIFTRKELTGYSIICPAIYKISKWFNMQQQIKRNGKPGSVDFLVNYKDYLIAMENKTDHMQIEKYPDLENDQGLFGAKSGKVTKVLKQIDGLELDKYDFLKENTKGLIRIALLSIVFSSTLRKIDNNKNDVDFKIKKIPQLIKEKYNKEFTYQRYWKFDEELKYPKHHHKEPEKNGLYDGILFLAHYR